MTRRSTDESSKVLDVAFRKEVPWEEKCWFYFREHPGYVTWALGLLVAAGLAVAVTLWGKDLYGRHLQKKFLALQSAEEKLAFAENHHSHPLAGTCFLELADTAYRARDYGLAARRYGQARKALKHSIFGGRAALGEAMSQLSGGEKEEGRIALLSTATDVHYPRSVRAGAFYLSAVLALERGKPHKAKQPLGYLIGGDYGEIWKEQAQKLAEEHHIEI